MSRWSEYIRFLEDLPQIAKEAPAHLFSTAHPLKSGDPTRKRAHQRSPEYLEQHRARALARRARAAASEITPATVPESTSHKE
jgi:hypothetical protein